MTKRDSSAWMLVFSFLAYLFNRDRPYRVVFRFQALADGRSQLLVIGDLPDQVSTILRELTDSPPPMLA